MTFGIRAAKYESQAGDTYHMDVYVNGTLHNAVCNGVVTNCIATTSTHRYYEIPFEPGELRAGWNEIELKSVVSRAKGYFMFDCFRFHLTGDRVKGTFLIFR